MHNMRRKFSFKAGKFKLKKRLRLLFLFFLISGIFTTIFLLLAHPSLAAWWPGTSGGSTWTQRKQLTVINDSGSAISSGTTIAVSLDTRSLYQAGKIRPDCADLRIVYQPNSTTFTELARAIVTPNNVSCSQSGATKVYFQIQSQLASMASSNLYYAYYFNPQASSPTNTLSAFNVGSSLATFVCPFDGTTTCIASGSGTPTSQAGAIRYSGSKSALYFDGQTNGTSDVVTGNTNLPAGQPFTVEFWINPRTFASNDGVIRPFTFSSLNYIDISSSGAITFAGLGCSTSYPSPTISANTWSHIAIVYTNSYTNLYVNGQKYPSSLCTSPQTFTNFTLGAQQTGYFSLNGYIDEFRVSTIARYSSNFTPPAAPFVRDAYTSVLYHLDENGQDPRNPTVAIDDSGNGNNGTITGAKYVAGLVGVDSSNSDTGSVDGSNAFAGHEGVAIESQAGNYIPNPSFEGTPFDNGWAVNNSTLSATLNTAFPYYKFGNQSVKLVNGSTATPSSYLISANPGTSDANILSAYVYNGASGSLGSTIDSTVAKLVFAGQTATPSGYLNMGGGWWRMYYRGFPNGYTQYSTANALSDQGLFTTTANKYLSQGFKVSQSGQVDYVAVDLKAVGTTFSSKYVGLEIQTDNGGVPSGTAVANGISPNCINPYNYNGAGSYNLHTGGTSFQFTTQPSLAANTQYYIVLKPYTNNTCTTEQSSPDATNYYTWGYDSAGTYTNGDRATMDTTNTWAAQSGQDHVFYLGNYTSGNYGVEVEAGKTVYVDGVQLENRWGYDTPWLPYRSDYSFMLNYPTTYIDGSLGSGYSWTGSPNNSSSSRASNDSGGYNYLTYSGAGGNINSATMSASLWFKPLVDYRNTADQDFQIASMLFRATDNSCEGNIDIQAHYPTGSQFDFWSFGGNKFTSYTVTSNWTGQWHHAVVTYNSSGYVTSYLDGSQVGQTTALPVGTINNFFVGGSPIGGCEPGTANAVISDFRLYSGELTSPQVADIYHAGLVSHSESYPVDAFSDNKGQNPVAIWHMDEEYGSTAHDSGILGNDLTLTNTAWATGSATLSQRTQYLNFNGTTSQATTDPGKVTNFDFGTNPFSIAGWFRHPSTASGIQTILSKYNGTAGYKVWMDSGGHICFGIDDSATWGPKDSACSAATYIDSTWHQFEAVRDTGLSVYIDGTLVGSKSPPLSASGSLSSSSVVYIGSDTNSSNWWNGSLDEIYIYPYARSASQVKTDYGGPQTASVLGSQIPDPLANGLVGYWKMDEATGSATLDSSGNSNTGTWYGSGTVHQTAGKFGNGGNFNGVDDYVSVADNDTLAQTNQKALTISYWINPTNINNGDAVISKCNNGSIYDCSYGLDFHGPNLRFTLGQSNGTISALETNSSLTATTGQWYHVAAVYDGSKMYLYLNGSLNSSATTSITGITNSSTLLYLGSGYNGSVPYRFMNGRLDDVRIYNRALSPAEIRQLYNWAPGPVVYYKFDEGTGTSTNDSSGNGNTGTFVGNMQWKSGKYGDSVWTAADNDNSFIRMLKSPQLSGAYTIDYWIKFDSAFPCCSWDNSSIQSAVNQGLQLTHYMGTEFILYHNYNGGSYLADWSGHAAIDDKLWHHVALTYNGTSTAEFFIDGKSQGTRSINPPVWNTSPGTSVLFQYANNASASVDDYRIYNYARTPAQIIQDMNGGHPAPGSPVGSAIVGYNFNEATGSTLNNTGSLGSTAAATASATTAWNLNGKFDSALQYDGTSAYASTPNLALLAGNGVNYTQASWDGWFNPTGSAASRTLLIKPNEFSLTTDANSKANCAVYSSGSWQTAAVSASALPLGSWSHVLCTYDSSNINVYINGVLSGTTAQTGAITSSNTTGLNLGWNGAGSGYFSGLMDDVKIYTFPLTSDQAQIEYNHGLSQVLGSISTVGGIASNSASAAFCVPGSSDPCSPPVGEWNLNENTGAVANDTSGNGNTLSFITDGTTLPKWVTGKTGSALQFDGSSNFLRKNTSTLITAYPFTLEAWMKTTGTSFNYPILALGDTADHNIRYMISTDGSGHSRIFAPGVATSGNAIIDDGKWHFLSLVFTNDTNRSMYVDGKFDHSDTTNTSYSSSVNSVSIGGGPPSFTEYFPGTVDNAQIYNYARTPAQIDWDYNRGAPVAQYDFDECSGSTVHNNALNSNNQANSTYDATIYPDASQTTGTCGSGVTTQMWNNGTNGKYGASLGFDGSGDYVGLSSGPVATSSGTISFWMYPTNTAKAAENPVFSSTNKYMNFENVSGTNNWGLNFAGGNYFTGTGVIFPNQWNFVTISWDGSSNWINIYVNAVIVINHAYLNTPTSSNLTKIGTRDTFDNRYFQGQIDEFRVYNYALTPAQVKVLYNNDSAVSF